MKKGLVCIVYVSTSKTSIIEGLKGSLRSFPAVKLAHHFVDAEYNRSSFFLVGRGEYASAAALSLCRSATSELNYAEHVGTHPTLGSVDHICFSPLGDESLETVGAVARSFAEDLTSSLCIPSYTYGTASPTQRRLSDIRRELGYFGGTDSSSGSSRADFGADMTRDSSKGISTIGAVPLIVNFNMRFRTQDARKDVLQVSKAVRNQAVEALTLQHGGGAFEVACNLLDIKSYGPKSVLAVAEEVAKSLGLRIEGHYCTGPQEEELLQYL